VLDIDLGAKTTRSAPGVTPAPSSRTRNPERVAAVAPLTWAYLRTEQYLGDSAWQATRDALAASPNPPGRVESK
jgi:hypothetical protein